MRAQFLRASSIVTLGIVATSGCSLIVATDGLTGGRDGETTAEPEPPDGNVVVSDAGPEASQDASPSPRFCAGSTVKFCADFEDPTVSHFGFTNWSLASGCSTVHTGERGTSLRCQCGKPGADDFANYQYSLLRKAHVVIDYDVAVESYGNVRANFVGLGTTDASREAVLTFSSSESANIFWRTPTTSGTVALNVSVPTGEWLYVREEFDFSAATPRLTAWVGTTRGDATKIGPTELAADFAVGTLHVAFGIGYSPPATSPTTLLLDNITVDTFD